MGKSIVLDLDGVLCENISYEEDPDYSNRKKLEGIEEVLKFIYVMDYKVIIHTSRYEEDREVTEKWLERNGIIYDELILGKPKAFMYIDDKAVTMRYLKDLFDKMRKTIEGEIFESNKS